MPLRLLLLAMLLSAGCDSATAPPVIITPIEVVPATATLTLRVGDTHHLSATVTGTENTGVTWSSEAETVVAVSPDGDVTAVGVGTASVVARSAADVTRTATVSITVGPAISVLVMPDSTDVFAGDSLQLSVTVSDTLAPGVVWASSDTAVARVSSTGLVTAAAAGRVLITATSTLDPRRSASAVVRVWVRDSTSFSLVASPDSVVLPRGQSTTVTVDVTCIGSVAFSGAHVTGTPSGVTVASAPLVPRCGTGMQYTLTATEAAQLGTAVLNIHVGATLPLNIPGRPGRFAYFTKTVAVTVVVTPEN